MAQSNYDLKARDLMIQAEKKLKGGFMDGLFGNKGQRAEEAVEFYKQAATQYKLAKNWEKSAEAYQQCAKCSRLAKGGEEAEFLMEAGHMIRKYNNAEAVKVYEQVVDIYCSEAKISQAAKIRKTIGEIYEKDNEFDLACKFYSDAADLFFTEQNYMSEYYKCKLKVAELKTMTGTGDCLEAIKIYEEVANKYLETPLLRPMAKNLFFQAALLYLANDDLVGCQKAQETYADLEPSLSQSREYKFVNKIIESINSKNVQEFSQACFEHNQIIPLDKWKTNILSTIKKLQLEGQSKEDQTFL